MSTDSVLARPPRLDLVLLAVAILAISASAPIIAAIAAPALAIAFWRCLIGAAATGAWVVVRRRAEVRGLSRQQWGLIIVSGLLLGAHFATWIPSLRFTSVASSTALVATQPIWAALIARARGVQIPRRAWIGIGIALAGVLVLTGVDASIDPRALVGDLLALIGAVFAALYVSVAEAARKTVTTATMTLGLYAAAAALLLVLCIVLRQPLSGYSAQDWALIILLTLTAQLVGHTLINRVLATTSATITSLAILFEMPGATIIAALAIGQMPPWSIIPALVLLFIGLAMVIRAARSPAPTQSPPI